VIIADDFYPFLLNDSLVEDLSSFFERLLED